MKNDRGTLIETERLQKAHYYINGFSNLVVNVSCKCSILLQSRVLSVTVAIMINSWCIHSID